MAKRTRKTVEEQPDKLSDQMKRRAARRNERRPAKKTKKFLSTGSTMLNLSFSDSVDGGWPIGQINTLPGQSSAGKTILVLSTFAEACINPDFDEYLLIYDDVERRCDFDMSKLFGALNDRLITPSGLLYKDLEGKEDESGISDTIQDLRNRMLMLKKERKPFIYVADSLDSFSTDEELEKEMKRAIAAAKTPEAAKKIAGSFNAEKAKITGQVLRMINGVVKETNSLFILTQQLRQTIGAMPGQSKYNTSGGEAPYFYSHIRPWLTKIAALKDNNIKIGVRSKSRMDKNSVTGKPRDVEFNIYYDLGIDDNASMVDFLIAEKHWTGGGWPEAKEFEIKVNGKDALVREIENQGLEGRMKRIVQKVWNKREEALLLNRKSRY